MIHRMSIILYRYKYRIEKIDRYPALQYILLVQTSAVSKRTTSQNAFNRMWITVLKIVINLGQ